MRPRAPTGRRRATSARSCSGSSRPPSPLTCNADTTHAAGIGTPPGSLQQAYQPPADGLSPLLFNATTVATSSPFTIGPNVGAATGKTTFQFDRRADVQAILDGDSRATYTFTLIDDTNGGARSELFRETLNDSDNTFQGQLNDQMPNVIPGHTYRIELSTVFDTAILSIALQKTIANFDNIRLRVEDGTPGFKEPGAITDPATDITETSATLNGRVNARGLPTTFVYRWGTNADRPAAQHPADDRLVQRRLAADVHQPAAHARRPDEVHDVLLRDRRNELAGHDERRQAVVHDRVRADRRRRSSRSRAPHAATFNSRINPRGLETKYFYEYKKATRRACALRVPPAGSELVIPAGTQRRGARTATPSAG